MGEAARRKQLRLLTTLAADVPRVVCLDSRHLRQVLLNLLSNAIKFTNEGEVRLVIARTGDDHLMFEVVDTGIGIAPDEVTTVFDAFTQTSSGASAGGSGLGLTISRDLVELMAGDLQVESALGSGSRFFFALPLVLCDPLCPDGSARNASAPPLTAVLAPGQALPVLVADDSTVNRRIMAELLETAGAVVIDAAGGEAAVALAIERRPDVVFMDLRMPDLDGLEATRRLKQHPMTADIPVIAVTASALGDAAQAARAAGCAGFLQKPIRAQALFASLEKHLGVRFIARPDAPSAFQPALTSARRLAIAERIRSAAALGDVTAVESLVAELSSRADESALGRRIGDLASTFDFDAVRGLADTLTEEAEHAGT
jgi:CheY-like chemotaxis protein